MKSNIEAQTEMNSDNSGSRSLTVLLLFATLKSYYYASDSGSIGEFLWKTSILGGL